VTLTRDLLTLARLGYAFPKHGVLRDVAPMPPRASFPTVRVRVLKPHYQLRRLVEPGEIVQLDEPTAIDAIALGRAERLLN
jgi:hypothetical protein